MVKACFIPTRPKYKGTFCERWPKYIHYAFDRHRIYRIYLGYMEFFLFSTPYTMIEMPLITAPQVKADATIFMSMYHFSDFKFKQVYKRLNSFSTE